MKSLDSFEQSLLDAWEDTHKKSQLTLWILLTLKDGPKHMAQIKTFIDDASNGNMSVDNQSMYRALRRLKSSKLIHFTLRLGRGGPDLKQYYLTATGHNVLEAFLERQLAPFFAYPLKSLLKISP